ncbi:MAG: AmmeMemoRadiSam system protein B [Deltaproteobacteria bacterium]|nr:AmmeMemoRadiSam system protein B [Deltaproteobacteria bacterium]
MATRRADFAGAWYPGTASDCKRTIEGLSEQGVQCPELGTPVLGGIVPHAGWYYSGRIACNVIRCAAQGRSVDTCIIIGRHLHTGSPNYIMTEGAWDTPLGPLEIDGEAGGRLASEFPFQVETAASYDQDNTIELQLPFVKYFFPEARILPLGLPPKDSSLRIGGRAAQICKELGRETVVLGSTDLTHYGYNYGFVPEGVGEAAVSWVKQVNDRRVVDLMVAMDAAGVIREAIQSSNACCAGAAGAAIAAAEELGASRGVELDYFTSYDVRPDDSFVGYVGVLFAP